MTLKKFGWLLILLLMGLTACNKDETITVAQKPVITFSNPEARYATKVGQPWSITPTVEHLGEGHLTWTMDEKVIGEELTLEYTFEEVGEYFIFLTAQNEAGKAEEEIMVEVLDYAKPLISLALPHEGLKLLPNTNYTFAPDVQNDDMEGFTITWTLDGKQVSNDRTYTFREATTGSHRMKIATQSVEGEDTLEFTFEVVGTLPYSASFPTLYVGQTTEERHTYQGRSVSLTPDLKYFTAPRFSWSVDGVVIPEAKSATYVLTPQSVGTYEVTVNVEEATQQKEALSRHITRGASQVSATIRVVARSSDEEAQHLRKATTSSQRNINKVYDYTPAPGQFIGESMVGFKGDETTYQQAIAYAEGRLKTTTANLKQNNSYLSLGSFGGYIVVGFDHSVEKGKAEYDFSIQGNAFDGSSEPAIVWVMQDVNQNGLPDDEWYELRGSETQKEGTIQNYEVTYYRPQHPSMRVEWTDNQGQRGSVDYLSEFHTQPYYYPQWVEADSYTLKGTRLKARKIYDVDRWKNLSFDWGYADNHGNDQMTKSSTSGEGNRIGFKIQNAMTQDCHSVSLQYVDFIKIQSAVLDKSDRIGEVSPEIFMVTDEGI